MGDGQFLHCLVQCFPPLVWLSKSAPEHLPLHTLHYWSMVFALVCKAPSPLWCLVSLCTCISLCIPTFWCIVMYTLRRTHGGNTITMLLALPMHALLLCRSAWIHWRPWLRSLHIHVSLHVLAGHQEAWRDQLALLGFLVLYHVWSHHYCLGGYWWHARHHCGCIYLQVLPID